MLDAKPRNPLANTVRWLARGLSGLLMLIIFGYIFLATMMITAAGEELFPKMALSFLALLALLAGLAAAWRWEAIGALITLAAWWGYRLVEEMRLGYSRPFGLISYLTLTAAVLFLASALLYWRAKPKPA